MRAGPGEEVDVEVTALRLWRLCLVQCALMVEATQHVRDPPTEAMELQAIHVKCMLRPDLLP